MASYVDMSLDDIIQKKKRGNPRNSASQRLPPVRKPTVLDARNKLNSIKRTQIRDARDKLIQIAKQKDARLKLQQLKAKKANFTASNLNSINNQRHFRNEKRNRVFSDPSRLVVSQPLQLTTRTRATKNKQFMGEKLVVSKQHVKQQLKPIIRTIENDVEVIDDPMGEEYQPTMSMLANRKASLQLKIVTHNNDSQRMAIHTKEKSPPKPQSILKKRAMASLKFNKNEQEVEKPPEFRIIVSNLRDIVTGADIKELFGDVGGMLDSRLVRPGTAEVIYKTVEDAKKAVDLYHNRHLDRQPMNCLLVTPRTTSTVTKSSSKPTLVSSNSNVEPDISTFHKVLFNSF